MGSTVIPEQAQVRWCCPAMGTCTERCTRVGAHGEPGSGGKVFEMTPAGRFTTIYDFCSHANCTDDGLPADGILRGTDGNLYEITAQPQLPNLGSNLSVPLRWASISVVSSCTTRSTSLEDSQFRSRGKMVRVSGSYSSVFSLSKAIPIGSCRKNNADTASNKCPYSALSWRRSCRISSRVRGMQR